MKTKTPEEILKKWLGNNYSPFLKSHTPQVIAAMQEFAGQFRLASHPSKSAGEILKKAPSVKLGMDDHYGRQTVLNMLNEALASHPSVPTREELDTVINDGINLYYSNEKIKFKEAIITAILKLLNP